MKTEKKQENSCRIPKDPPLIQSPGGWRNAWEPLWRRGARRLWQDCSPLCGTAGKKPVGCWVLMGQLIGILVRQWDFMDIDIDIIRWKYEWDNMASSEIPDENGAFCENHKTKCRMFYGIFVCARVALPVAQQDSWHSSSIQGWPWKSTQRFSGQDVLTKMTGWWFGTMEFYDFPYIGNFIIPTDELHHFSEG